MSLRHLRVGDGLRLLQAECAELEDRKVLRGVLAAGRTLSFGEVQQVPRIPSVCFTGFPASEDEREQRLQAETCCEQLVQALEGALERICIELQLSFGMLLACSAWFRVTHMQRRKVVFPRHSRGAARAVPAKLMQFVLQCC